MASAATATQPRTLEYVDPADLLTDTNIRDAEVDDDFVATVRDVGILVPVVAVRTKDGRLRVRLGHRRVKAAELAGAQVPVIVAGAEGSSKAAQVTRIIEQYAENTQRAGLTTAQKVGVVAALFEYGQSAAQIHKRTRIPADDIARAKTIAASELALKAAQRWDFLDLEQDADIAAWENDPEAVKALVAAAKQGRGHYDHVRQELIDTAAERAQKRDLLDALQAAGIPVVEGSPWGSTVGHFADADGTPLTEDGHRSCPGHAVFLRKSWASGAAEAERLTANAMAAAAGIAMPAEPEDDQDEEYDDEEIADDDDGMGTGSRAVWQPEAVCTDPGGNGHQQRVMGYGPAARKKAADMEPEEREKARAERARIIDGNRRWKTARSVRRQWIAAALAPAKKPPAGGMRWVIDLLALGPSELRIAMEKGHPLAAEMLGLDPAEASKWGRSGEFMRNATKGVNDARAQAIAVLIAVCAIEGWINDNAWREDRTVPWRTWPSSTGRFLRILQGWGYTLSAGEEEVAATADPDPDPETAPARHLPQAEVGPAALTPGTPLPGQPGHVQGECGHPVPLQEYQAGWRTCEHCRAENDPVMCQVPGDCPNGPGPHVYDPAGEDGENPMPPCCPQPGQGEGEAERHFQAYPGADGDLVPEDDPGSDPDVPPAAAGYAGDDAESSRR